MIEDTEPTTDQLLNLARAVAAPGQSAMYRGVDGKADGYDSIECAASSGRAYMVGLRDGLIAIDADPTEGDFSWVTGTVALAEQQNCRIVRVGSGRSDHQHVFILSPIGWTSEDLIAGLNMDGLRKHLRHGLGRKIRPPLSPHHRGGVGQLIEPATVEQATLLLRYRHGYTPLKQVWGQRLSGAIAAEQLTNAGTLDRGRFTRAVAVAYVNADMPEMEFREAILTSALPYLKEKARPDWLAKKWASAQKFVKQHPPTGTAFDDMIDGLSMLNLSYPWAKGRAGSTDQRMHAGLIAIASEARNNPFKRSQRSLEEKLSITRRTVGRSLARLTASGLLLVAGRGNLEANSYRLLTKDAVTTPVERCSPIRTAAIGVVSSTFGDSVPDAFRGYGSLGEPCWLTYQCLPEGQPFTVAQARADRPACTQATMREHLQRLQSAGMAERLTPTGQQWRKLPVTQDKLDRLAMHCGTTGKAEKVKLQNAAQRARFATWQPSDDDGLAA